MQVSRTVKGQFKVLVLPIDFFMMQLSSQAPAMVNDRPMSWIDPLIQ